MGKKRFVEVYSQGINHGQKILVDTETGVNYLVVIPHLTEGCGPVSYTHLDVYKRQLL